MLGKYTLGLEQERQRIGELKLATGLPRQMRSSLADRGRWTESESKLAAEMLGIIADANQMVSWLDGRIEVHVELMDKAANPPVALLQFGSP